MNLKTGHLLAGGRYKVERVLGQGGFGITYLCEQTGLLRKVTIKEFFMREYCERDHDTATISLGSSGSRDMVERFRQKFIKEARTIAALSHKHIVRIIDVFEENNTAYYVMEYVGGGSLSDKVKAGALDEATALRYIRQVATALELVHSKHMMHLDIKPSNILLNENDEAVLIDFGLAKQYDAAGSQTSTTPVGISHGYAPLEQYRQGGVGTFSPATDIYSLGATLYKLLTGQTPPEAGDVNDDGLPALPPHISAPVRAAIETAMQPRRKDRPQSVGEFLALLDKKVKAENGKVETESNDDGTTIVGGSVMNNEILRSAQNDKEQKSVISSESEKSFESGEKEILHSVQDDKKREPVISSESEKSLDNGEKEILCSALDDKERAASTDAGTTVLLTNDKLSPCLRGTSNDVAEGVEERKVLHTDGKKRNSPKRSFNKGLITIIAVAIICMIATFFGIRSCNESKNAEIKAQQTTVIAESETIDCSRGTSIEPVAMPSHGTINGHEYVDLGLSVKWATCNVGASKPEDYGGYYAWGETEEKENYSWSTYKWCKGSFDTQTKYCTDSSYGTVDNKTVLAPQDDVAHVKWGGTWRMPTKAEQDELRNNCTWTWTTQNGVNGYKVTGPNANSIFLPAAGCRGGTGVDGRGSSGYYWSSSLHSSNSNYAYQLYFDSGSHDRSNYLRYNGQSVRPVSK